jgi:hypothetical protein
MKEKNDSKYENLNSKIHPEVSAIFEGISILVLSVPISIKRNLE